MKAYDLVVLGSGPAGEKAALHAAYHGFKVAVVEKSAAFGGAGVNTGTLPSKTLKETALYLSGQRERRRYSVERVLNHEPTAADFLFRERYVVKTESEEFRLQLLGRHVDLYHGTGAFADAHTIEVHGETVERLSGENILIATGSSPAHAAGVPFDGRRVHDSDTIFQIDHVPPSLCVVGAGVIGCEYATIFAAMGSRVTLVNSHGDLLPFLDREVVRAFAEEVGKAGVELRNGPQIQSVSVEQLPGGESVHARCADGTVLAADMFLYAVGRNGNTKDLGLDRAGLQAAEHGTLQVDAACRTAVPHIYAAGDVIGFPALGSTSMEQGRLAVIDMFGLHDLERIARQFPFGIYTIPEMAMIGLTEEKAREQGIDFVVGRARHEDTPRGLILGLQCGFLKLICDRQSQKILGAHLIGHSATELIHYGMELVENREPLKRVLGTVFNFPTLHELYKYAAYDLWSRELKR